MIAEALKKCFQKRERGMLGFHREAPNVSGRCIDNEQIHSGPVDAGDLFVYWFLSI